MAKYRTITHTQVVLALFLSLALPLWDGCAINFKVTGLTQKLQRATSTLSLAHRHTHTHTHIDTM